MPGQRCVVWWLGIVRLLSRLGVERESLEANKKNLYEMTCKGECAGGAAVE